MLTNDYNIKFPKDKNDNQGRDKNPYVAIWRMASPTARIEEMLIKDINSWR